VATAEERKEFLRGLFCSPHGHVFDEAMERLCDEAAEEWGERRDEAMGAEEWDPEAMFESWWSIYHRYSAALAPLAAQREERRLRIYSARIDASLARAEGELDEALNGLAMTSPALADKVRAAAAAIADYRRFGTQPTGGT